MKIQVWLAKEHIFRNSLFYREDSKIFDKLSAMNAKRDGEYDHVATIEATDLNDAYSKTQNFRDLWNGEKKSRSTCVGDIFKIEDEHRCKFHIIAPYGFDKLLII